MGVEGLESLPDVSSFPATSLDFWKEPGTFSFKAKVLGTVGCFLVLDRTFFFPRMGGQDFDCGLIDDRSVYEVFISNGIVLHKVEGASLFNAGQEVNCQIDEDRREILSMTHTGVHIMGMAARIVFGKNVMQVGNEKTVAKGRVDLSIPNYIDLIDIHKLELQANELVSEDLPVTIFSMPKQEAEEKYSKFIYQGGEAESSELRLVKVGGEVQSCGGLHASSTGEVGLIKVIHWDKAREGAWRVEFVIGSNALKVVQKNEAVLHGLSELWGVQLDNVLPAGKKFFSEWKEQRKELKDLREKFARLVVEKELSSGNNDLSIELPIDEMGLLINLVEGSDLKGKSLVLKGSNIAYGISNTHVSIADELKKFCITVEGDNRKAKGFKFL